MKIFDWIIVVILAITLVMAEIAFQSGDTLQAFFVLAKMAVIALTFIYLIMNRSA